MDVTCNRCGTVYEFEEGLISTTGTTVKCTQCGHLFKVHRPSPLPPANGAGDIALEPSRWRVRRVDGSTHTLDSLAELSNLIGAGQFGADDEISRTGHIWKRLGEIAELSSLFERPARPRRMSEPPPQPQLPIAAAVEEAKRITASDRPGSSSDAPRRRVPTDPRFHVMGADVEIDSQRPSAPPPESVDDERATAPHAPQSAVPPAAPSSAPPPAQTGPASQPAPASTPAPAPVASADAEVQDEPLDDLRRAPRGARPLLVACVLLLAAGIGAAALVHSRATTAVPDPARALLERADAALAEHQPESFQRSIGLYTQALALHPEDAHTLASISRAYAIWSQWLREDLQDKPADPAAALADNVARAEAQRVAEQARQYAVRATQHAQGAVEAAVALGDALRLSGELAPARSEIERARANESAPTAETLRVAALLAIDAAGNVASAGRKLAEQAVARSPNLIRTRLLLARCLLDDKDIDGARQQLDAVRSLAGDHPGVTRLEQAIEALPRSTQTGAHKSPTGSAANQPQPAQPAQPQPPAQPAPPSSAPSKPAAAPAEESASDSSDPSELVRRGEKALERGAVQVAENAFQRALEIEPRFARAKTGLGYVALERNQASAAIAYFRPAAAHGHAEAFIGMGDAYRRIGHTREALEAYQTYLKRFPEGPRRSIAQHQTELLSEQLEGH